MIGNINMTYKNPHPKGSKESWNEIFREVKVRLVKPYGFPEVDAKYPVGITGVVIDKNGLYDDNCKIITVKWENSGYFSGIDKSQLEIIE